MVLLTDRALDGRGAVLVNASIGMRSMVHTYRSQVSAAALAGCDQVEHATYATAEEFLGRVEHCGQTPMAALISAQSLTAEALGLGDRIGRLAGGYDADIIALDGDPLTDITAVRRVIFVMRGGVILKWAPVARPAR